MNKLRQVRKSKELTLKEVAEDVKGKDDTLVYAEINVF